MVKGVSGSKIIGSTWTAPANCKSNNNVNDGGHLNTSCYTSWATAITKFAKDNGLYAMSVSNEPEFASCGSMDPCNGNYPTMLYTANEMVAFVKVVGPMLQQAGIKVISPETSEWDHLWSNKSAGPDPGGHNSSDPLKCGFPPSNTVCDTGGGYDYGHYLAKDTAAWAAFDIIGTHQYDSQHAYAWPSDVTAARKEVWQTEMSGVKWWPEQGPSSDINNGIAVAGWIHEALAIGDASAWLYWNYSQTGDNEGLVLGSTDTKRHWTLGNYSKFVRPGYKRVEVAGAIPANVFLTAYVGSDGTVVVVAINKASAAVSVPITIAGGTAPASMTPWVTSSTDNLASKTAVTVANGTFTAALGASTVTTFVGK
jgi:glucuronoarabinoxylan endo-1,4-beta-xylanase